MAENLKTNEKFLAMTYNHFKEYLYQIRILLKDPSLNQNYKHLEQHKQAIETNISKLEKLVMN